MIKKYEELVSKLKDSTAKRKLVWEKTSRENEYQTAIGGNAISVLYHEKDFISMTLNNDETYMSLLIWNNKGENIDEVRIKEGKYDFDVLKELYDSARRSYMKVEETLDDILSNLD